jgi:Flp pilus assembly protein TadG
VTVPTRRRRGDRGEALVQQVILVPIVLLIAMMGIQAAIYFHAANVAEHASSRAVSIASRQGSSNSAGAAEAAATVAGSGSVLVGVSVTGSTTVTARVTVAVSRILPLLPSRVTRSASEPKERYVPENER